MLAGQIWGRCIPPLEACHLTMINRLYGSIVSLRSPRWHMFMPTSLEFCSAATQLTDDLIHPSSECCLEAPFSQEQLPPIPLCWGDFPSMRAMHKQIPTAMLMYLQEMLLTHAEWGVESIAVSNGELCHPPPPLMLAMNQWIFNNLQRDPRHWRLMRRLVVLKYSHFVNKQFSRTL